MGKVTERRIYGTAGTRNTGHFPWIFCRELVNSVKMVFGDVTRLESLPLEEGMDPEAYEEQLNRLIDSYDGNVFVCVDIMGGHPLNLLQRQPVLDVYTGSRESACQC